MYWPFSESKNTAVFTTKSIMNGESNILKVYHHEDDGAWEFQDNRNTGTDNVAVISLEEITIIDKTILQLYSLEFGYHAYRNSTSESWKIGKTI